MLRKSLSIKKIGHSGTLDPFASGVVVIGINEATKLFKFLPNDKVYLAEVTFGLSTDTDDITGNVLKTSDFIPTLEMVTKEIKNFIGKIKQKPPIYSAIKIDGCRAYDLAREKKITLDDIEEKEVEIYSIEIVSFVKNKIKLKIHCSNGTYIRSFARDLGKQLNTYATLSSLVRTKVGKCFLFNKSINPKSVNVSNVVNYLISPLLVLNFPHIYLNSKQIDDVCHGKSIKVDLLNNVETLHAMSLLDNNNKLIAIGSLTKGCIIKPQKVFIKK